MTWLVVMAIGAVVEVWVAAGIKHRKDTKEDRMWDLDDAIIALVGLVLVVVGLVGFAIDGF